MSKVLVADDSATIRGVAESLLRHNGYEVISTSDGSKALAMAKSQNPDLIFLDHAMPGKDGLAVCRELKADPHTRNIPVIMLLGAGEAREAEKFLSAGASDCLVKPFVPKDFIEKAQKHLSPFAQGSTFAQDTSKIAASSLLEEALSSAGKEEEELDLEKLLGAASSKQLEEETGKVPALPPQVSPPAEPERWGPASPDEMTIKLFRPDEKTKSKAHERPKKSERSKTAAGPVKSDSDKLKLEKDKERDDLILASNPFGLGEEEQGLAFGAGSSPEVPHDYDWFLKEMQKESQAALSGPSTKPVPAAPPPVSKRKEESSEELKLKVEELGTSRLGYERFINEFKKEMMKLETEEKPVYGETKIDPQAVVEAQQKVKTDKVKIASAPTDPAPASVPAAPAINPEELVNQVVSAVVREVAQKISSQLDKEEILRLLQEKLGKLEK
ncbi:MAG: response regulator [candidate division Zixibacteria bacterium]|nr:response regulator [candidate division Zixibacteria bacterium]MCI0594982.1 response regulator [candidate division Zixibacteria bacterium]